MAYLIFFTTNSFLLAINIINSYYGSYKMFHLCIPRLLDSWILGFSVQLTPLDGSPINVTVFVTVFVLQTSISTSASTSTTIILSVCMCGTRGHVFRPRPHTGDMISAMCLRSTNTGRVYGLVLSYVHLLARLGLLHTHTLWDSGSGSGRGVIREGARGVIRAGETS